MTFCPCRISVLPMTGNRNPEIFTKKSQITKISLLLIGSMIPDLVESLNSKQTYLMLVHGQNRKREEKADMGKEDGRGRSRRRRISRARKFLNHEGKKLCASALCVSMLFGSVMNTTIAASKETDDDGYEFELSRASLYQALQDAVLNGSTVDEELEFYGSAAEEYSELLAPGGSLYELKPELKDNDGSLKLRVFAKLDQEIELDSEYEAAGTEEIMFLLTNRSDEPQKAVICVDDKYTEEIEVAPGGAIAVPEDEAAQGPAGGGTAGGGASAGGGAAGGENAGAGETAGPADENGQAPDSGETPAQTQPEETTGAKEETDADTSEDASAPTEETGNAGDSQAPADETEGVSDSGQTEESGAAGEENDSTAAEDGSAAGGENESDEGKSPAGENGSGETGNTAGKEENGADGSGNAAGGDGNSGAAESGDQTDTGSGENAGSSTENGSSSAAGSENSSAGSGSASGNDSPAGNTGAESDGGNDSSDSVSEGEKTVAATISLHRANLVAAPAKEDPMATDSELPVATDSELATDSEMEKLIDGDLYEAVRLKEDGAVLFVTTLDDLGVMDGWGPIVFGQQFEQEIDGFRVRAIARKGVLPDGAEMSVVQLTPEEHPDQYNEAVNALAEAGTQYEGMAALDISFHDSEGTEIEPNGEVQVSIELKEGALPEDADPSTVVVQHLKETGDAIQVEKVADASNDTDGIVALADKLTDPDEIEVSDEAQAVAAFRVESFSTFTITWQGFISSKEIRFQLYTEDNGEYEQITGVSAPEIPPADNGQEVVIADKAALKGYIYLRAEYWKNNIKQCEIDKIKASKDGLLSGWEVKVHESGTGENNWIPIYEKSPDLRLIYSEDTVVPPVTPERELSKTKKVWDNSDGTYDLELSISGAVGTVQNKAPLDILFIVDISNSMSWGMGGESSIGPSRIYYVKNAINNLINSISENDGIDARYNVVTFKSYADELTNGWVDNAQSVRNALEDIRVNDFIFGGTDYTEAISKGNTQLNDVRSEANSVVIFLSDGEPDNNNYTNIKKMSCTYFYAIGVGSSFNESSSSASKTLKYLCDNVGATNKGSDPYLATDTSSLEQAFEDIALDATTILCNNVIISDELSENVEAVLNDFGPESLTVTVLGENGNIYRGPSSSITLPETEENSVAILTPTYDVNTKTISLIFPEEYKLEKGWTYKVNLKVAATDQAYKNLQDPEYEKAFGDKDTGTYSEKEGLYSNVNDKATVTYTYNGEEPTEYFPKPVIQLTVADLTINKTVQGLDDDDKALEELKSELKFLIKDSEDKVVREISYSDFTDGVKTVEDLKPGTYTVSESGFDDIDGYTFKTPNDQVSQTIEVEIDGNNQVRFTNKYAKDLIIPTGIFNDKLPYLLMSSVAILCTAGVLFNNSIKRRRENEE